MKNVEHKWTVQDMPSQAGRLALVTGANRVSASMQRRNFLGREPQ